MTGGRWCLAATLLAMAAGTGRLDAQVERSYPRWYLGIAGEYGRATGDAQAYIRDGGGLSMYGAWRAGRTSPFLLRMSGNVLIYGSTTDTYTVPPGIDVDVTTTNTLAGFGIGPEYVAGGEHLEAFIFATAGGTYIATTSAVSGSNSNTTTQLDDFAWAGEVGGGLFIHLSPGFAIEGGARYRYTGEITYLPRGQAAPSAVTTEVGLMLYHVGVTWKLGGIRPHRPAREKDGSEAER
jgi:hypothetical protein